VDKPASAVELGNGVFSWPRAIHRCDAVERLELNEKWLRAGRLRRYAGHAAL